MKTRVEVEVNLMRLVTLEVEHDEDEDPCDLTADERADAMDDACTLDSRGMGAEIVRVRAVSMPKHSRNETEKP